MADRPPKWQRTAERATEIRPARNLLPWEQGRARWLHSMPITTKNEMDAQRAAMILILNRD
jgi:hypothetical protein